MEGPLGLDGVFTGNLRGFSGGPLGPTGLCVHRRLLRWKLGASWYHMGGKKIRSVVIGPRRESTFSSSRFWNGQEMSSVSTVLLSCSFHNVRPLLRSWVLDNAYFLVPSVSLKSHDLL